MSRLLDGIVLFIGLPVIAVAALLSPLWIPPAAASTAGLFVDQSTADVVGAAILGIELLIAAIAVIWWQIVPKMSKDGFKRGLRRGTWALFFGLVAGFIGFGLGMLFQVDPIVPALFNYLVVFCISYFAVVLVDRDQCRASENTP